MTWWRGCAGNWTARFPRRGHRIGCGTQQRPALLLSRVPVHVVSRRLGHADVQTTLQLYAHVTEDADLQAAARWQAFTAGWRLSAPGDKAAGACL